MPLNSASLVALLLVSALPFTLLDASPTSAVAPTSVRHCGAALVASADDETTAQTIVCFGSEQELYNYATEHWLSTARGASATQLLGTLYKGKNRTGDSLSLWGGGTCSGVTFGFSSLAHEWATSVQSVAATGKCWVTLYTGTNYGGSKLNCTPICNTLGTWRGNTKSVVFRPIGIIG